MSQAERLKKVINSLLESPKSFSESIGLPSPTTIYDILASKRKLTPAIMKKIIETYPNLNPDWLLEGKGDQMLYQNKNPMQILEEPDYKEQYIKSLEERIKEQEKTIDNYEKVLDILKTLGADKLPSSNGDPLHPMHKA